MHYLLRYYNGKYTRNYLKFSDILISFSPVLPPAMFAYPKKLKSMVQELSNEPKLFEIGPRSSKNEPDQNIQSMFFVYKNTLGGELLISL